MSNSRTSLFLPFVTILLAFESLSVLGQTVSNRTEVDFAAIAHKSYVETREQYQRDTNNIEAEWQFARACFNLGEFAASSHDRAAIAETGINISKDLVTRSPKLGAAHYYLAMNLGQMARTKTLGALRLVDQMETEFLLAIKLDEHFENAGPDRNLGQLYFEAPSFGSIGSRSKARQHLRRAVELEPSYPENHILLAEAYLRWGDKISAAKELKALEQIWDAAKKKWTGDNWSASWDDWESRRAKLKDELKDVSKELETPRRKD